MRHALSRIQPYSPDQLFDLVGDVQRYPEFVPWITSLRTWNARDEGEGVTSLDAEARVGFSFLTERFSTKVRRDANLKRITVSLISGPFKRLHNQWDFHDHPDGAKVDFLIDFEFKSKMLELLLAANFHHAVNRLIGCFDDRAKALYGPGIPKT